MTHYNESQDGGKAIKEEQKRKWKKREDDEMTEEDDEFENYLNKIYLFFKPLPFDTRARIIENIRGRYKEHKEKLKSKILADFVEKSKSKKSNEKKKIIAKVWKEYIAKSAFPDSLEFKKWEDEFPYEAGKGYYGFLMYLFEKCYDTGYKTALKAYEEGKE